VAGTAVEPMKEIQKFMWSLGDYGQIARITEVASGKLAEACGIAPGMAVLDVAAGNGNFAVLPPDGGQASLPPTSPRR
jgi:2-polyprenyl-3-methyl-5-hydroxy-6-metoxy-1,4-benzoquinol methylase